MGTSAKTSGEEKENDVNMATAPSSPRLTAPSATESTNSTPHVSLNPVEDDAIKNGGLLHTDEVKPDNDDGLDHLDSKQCIERFRNYENEFTHRLLAKYFSGNNLNGGNSFYEEITIGDEVIIKASRVPCFQIYADSVVGFEEQCSNESSSPAETQDITPIGTPKVKEG
ncbi:uncharacterized protein LOC131594909 [Vicia villosa]|uniref:uncharacterized protein LOC131594909 n=1 Tax=Vicia villosa TaxID=3911 RepID=UPI00273A9553|nr:uncharacterized protein LOC131594909 [Vicia villosa]